MSFLKKMIKEAVDEGISKGISNAVEKAAEKIVAPKAEAYANKVAETLDEATGALSTETPEKPPVKRGFASLQESLNKLSQSAERYAAVMEKTVASKEQFLNEWSEKLPEFPVWCFGGTNFEINENGKTSDGNTFYLFDADDCTQDDLDMYAMLLLKDGFMRVWPNTEETLYKVVDGEYLVFNKTEAFNAAPHMTIALFKTKDRTEFGN